MNSIFKLALLLIAASASNAWAAGVIDPKSDVKVASLDDAKCRKEITQYIDAMQFVRQSAGEQVGEQVMKNYVDIDQLKQTAFNSGNCAGAQLLREKRATR